MKLFVDANILIYAAGREHRAKAPCLRLLRDVGSGEVEAVLDTEVLQEVLYYYWRAGAMREGLQLCDHALEAIPDVRPVTKADVIVARHLLTDHPTIEPRDAIHAAVMFTHGLTHLYSYDHHFDRLPGLTRLEP